MKNYALTILFDEVRKSNLPQATIDLIEQVFKIADEHRVELKIVDK